MADECHPESTFDKSDCDLLPWLNVSREDSSPFVHRFKTRRQAYAYDVNTRRIIRVSSIVWDLLEDYGHLDEGDIVSKHSDRYGEDEITTALGEIALARKQNGLFLSVRPEQVVLPDREEIGKRLEEERKQLVLNVTDDCNFRCSYCVYGGNHQQYRTHSPKSMSWEVARLAIDEFLAHSRCADSRVISFYGGEPLLNLPLIRRCVAYAEQNCADREVGFSMTTNASLLRGETSEFLAAKTFMIVVSLDGPSEIHDRHRRTKGDQPTWERVLSNVRDFLEAHPEYRTNNRMRFTAVANGATDLASAQRFWSSEEAFTETMGLQVSPQKQTTAEPVVRSPDDPLTRTGKALYGEFIESLVSGRFGDERSHRSRWLHAALFERAFLDFHKRGFFSPHLPHKMTFLNHCVPGARRTFVNTEGDYFACERVVPCSEQVIGNVRQGVQLDRVMVLLTQWAEPSREECRYCWCLPTCRAGCVATVESDGVVTEEAKKTACASHRRQMHETITEYCSILEENPSAFDYMADFQVQ